MPERESQSYNDFSVDDQASRNAAAVRYDPTASRSTEFEALAGRLLDSSRVSSLMQEGMVEMTHHGRLRVSSSGFPLLGMVVADLAA